MLLLRPRENLIAPVWIMFLYTPLVVCLSEINASESIAQVLYSMHILCFHIYTRYLITNLLLSLTIQHRVWQL